MNFFLFLEQNQMHLILGDLLLIVLFRKRQSEEMLLGGK